MKFKYIFIIFNIFIVLFLLVIAVLPVVMLGPGHTGKIWISSWPLTLLLALVMIGLNVFFLANHRLFALLEREDWPALADYLERRVMNTGRYPPRMVKLLANSYLIMSDFGGVLRLEKKLALEKPVLLEKNALVFGAARILRGDSVGAADFFRVRLENQKMGNVQWTRWYYGFSLMLSRAFGKAEAEFKELAGTCDDALISGLSAWFLADTLAKYSADREACQAAAGDGRLRVRQTLKKIERWKKESAKIENEIHAAIIRKYLDEAAIWLFSGSDYE